MQNTETRRKLANLLLDIAEGERQIEVLRQILCELKEFEPYAAFQRIDRSRKNSLTVADILKFLSENHMPHTEEYCSIFLRHYDIDSDNRLDYSEFLKVVLPADNPPLRALVTQKETYKVSEEEILKHEVECALVNLIDKEISLYLRLDAQKVILVQSEDYKNLDAFIMVDVDGSGRITFSNLKQYFQKEQVYPTDEEIFALLRRLDRDGDGLVPFEDFIQAIQPLEFNTNTLVDHLKTASLHTQSPIQDSLRSTQNIKFAQTAGISSSPIKIEGPARMYASADRFGKTTTSILKEKYSPKVDRSPERTTTTRSKGLFNKYPGTESPGKYRKEASPYRRVGAYSEITKGNRDYGSASREDRKEYEYQRPKVSSFETSYESVNVYKREKSPLGKSGKKFSTLKAGDLYEESSKAILDMLRHVMYLDKEVDDVKKELMLKSDFDMFSLFRSFDIEDRVRLCDVDIEKGMQKYGIYPDNEELFLFMRRFDQKNREDLEYKDFVEIFKPIQYDSQSTWSNKALKNSFNTSDPVQIFTNETRSLISKTLRLHLENEKVIEALRKGLKKRSTFNLRRAFNDFDKNGDGFLTRETIKSCFEERGIYLLKKELDLVVHRLDHNREGRISYLDFLNEINPKS